VSGDMRLLHVVSLKDEERQPPSPAQPSQLTCLLSRDGVIGGTELFFIITVAFGVPQDPCCSLNGNHLHGPLDEREEMRN
jgi:hypothetical protein